MVHKVKQTWQSRKRGRREVPLFLAYEPSWCSTIFISSPFAKTFSVLSTKYNSIYFKPFEFIHSNIYLHRSKEIQHCTPAYGPIATLL